MNQRIQKWTNTSLFLAMILINGLANIIPFGFGSTSDISEKYANLFTPSPLTFFILGIIYLFLGAFILYQWELFDKGKNSSFIRQNISFWFALSCIFNIGWIFSWHYDIVWLSVLLMISLLFSLIILNQKVTINELDIVDKLCVSIGFEIYYGWIIVATMANFTMFFKSIEWNRFGLSETFWASLVLILGACIGIAVIFKTQKAIPVFTIIGAYIGILVQHITKNGFNGRYPIVIFFTTTGIIIMSLGIILFWIYNQNQPILDIHNK